MSFLGLYIEIPLFSDTSTLNRLELEILENAKKHIPENKGGREGVSREGRLDGKWSNSLFCLINNSLIQYLNTAFKHVLKIFPKETKHFLNETHFHQTTKLLKSLVIY